ncbi:MAG: hypothetical protein Q8Q10_04570, partial [bacterium]|nr:hypothetical protein [bacterium]
VQDMEDFKTGVSWISLDENKKLFNKANSVNVYTTYDLVCNILEKNGDTNICLKSNDKLTDEIIKKF